LNVQEAVPLVPRCGCEGFKVESYRAFEVIEGSPWYSPKDNLEGGTGEGFKMIGLKTKSSLGLDNHREGFLYT
jgi:hypothetical protein